MPLLIRIIVISNHVSVLCIPVQVTIWYIQATNKNIPTTP